MAAHPPHAALSLTPQARHVADDHAVASLLLSRFNFLRRPGLHVVHIASEMVPVSAAAARHAQPVAQLPPVQGLRSARASAGALSRHRNAPARAPQVAKVGGLGDVVTGLAKAHQQRCAVPRSPPPHPARHAALPARGRQ